MDESYSCWLIEHSEINLCIGMCGVEFKWVTFTDPDALQFARKADAEMVMRLIDPMTRAMGVPRDHMFCCGPQESVSMVRFPPRGPDTCICADPENCTTPVKGCRALMGSTTMVGCQAAINDLWEGYRERCNYCQGDMGLCISCPGPCRGREAVRAFAKLQVPIKGLISSERLMNEMTTPGLIETLKRVADELPVYREETAARLREAAKRLANFYEQYASTVARQQPHTEGK